ncbi:DUF4133 domain-containing protein [Chitinophaga horti]|uniref:DUF4133 domain-containing protein n=1 Tax=Chitinophaga horti TaxID=2920382 RepID=A0ABY6J1H7_9BACT|nr:DUF4133 domain-containing protein [Chitinophaga horti]UYQ92159.1 DUF4133 domain-containing protein [Chitinophaga horti]
MNSVYQINKGINRSIEFKGLKAQYIWFMGAGIVVLLILYAIMYFLKFNDLLAIAIVLSLGAGLAYKLYEMSNTYGEHGLMKKMARRGVPKVVKVKSRKVFLFESPARR